MFSFAEISIPLLIVVIIMKRTRYSLHTMAYPVDASENDDGELETLRQSLMTQREEEESWRTRREEQNKS